MDVTSGFPQGTALGRLQLLVYVNEMPENILSTSRLFADDTLVDRITHTKEDQIKLQEYLAKLEQCDKDWPMDFHPDKCEVLRITKKKKSLIQMELNYRQWTKRNILEQPSVCTSPGTNVSQRKPPTV